MKKILKFVAISGGLILAFLVGGYLGYDVKDFETKTTITYLEKAGKLQRDKVELAAEQLQTAEKMLNGELTTKEGQELLSLVTEKVKQKNDEIEVLEAEYKKEMEAQ